jgi:hypothetical protein
VPATLTATISSGPRLVPEVDEDGNVTAINEETLTVDVLTGARTFSVRRIPLEKGK